MLKVVLCDDEYIVVEALKVLIDWAGLGMELVGTAQDGLSALQLVRDHSPDIILSDIRMPGLDGLQLIEIVKEELPQTACIIFSGFNDYHYVKQAIQIGVMDYLEKPISDESIERSLLKVKAEVEKQRQVELLSKQVELNHRHIVEMKLKDFLLSPSAWDDTIELSPGERLSDARRFTVCISEERLEAEALLQIPVYSFFHNKYWVNVVLEQDHLEGSLKEWFVIYYVDEQSIGIGDSYEMISQLRKSFDEAIIAYDYSKKLQHEKIVAIRDLSAEFDDSHIKQEMEQLINLRLSLLTSIEAKDMKRFQLVNEQFVIFCKCATLSYPFIESEMLFILLSLSKREIANMFPNNIAPTFPSYKETSRLYSVEELVDWYMLQIQTLEMSNTIDEGHRKPTSIAIALDYIKGNCDKDLTLQEVAEQAGLHPAYFSMLFKEVTGENFVKYRTKCKIEYAKQLLEKGKNVSEVCEEVGFLTYRHFSSVFKKQTGYTPGLYKSLHT